MPKKSIRHAHRSSCLRARNALMTSWEPPGSRYNRRSLEYSRAARHQTLDARHHRRLIILKLRTSPANPWNNARSSPPSRRRRPETRRFRGEQKTQDRTSMRIIEVPFQSWANNMLREGLIDPKLPGSFFISGRCGQTRASIRMVPFSIRRSGVASRLARRRRWRAP